MELKNGIAYSGSKEKCGTLEDKILNAKKNKVKFIQVRTKDISDILLTDNKIDKEKLPYFTNLIKSYDGEISVHLPNPEWDYSLLQLSEINQLVPSTIKDILVPLGIKTYTIHPHFNKEVYKNLSPLMKKKVLLVMGNYFADLVLAGAYLAIENVPVRDLEKIKNMPDSFEKEHNLKNISYGMTMSEIDKILSVTRKSIELKAEDPQLSNGRVGITYDTGHSIKHIDDEQQKRTEIEMWIQFFKNDIMVYHITPSIKNNLDGTDSVKEQDSKHIIDLVCEFTKKYNVNAITLVEANASLKSMTELYSILSTSLQNAELANNKDEKSYIER